MFGSKIRGYLFDTCLELYVRFISPERRHLVELGEKTEAEINWSYFLAQDLIIYRFQTHDITEQQQTLLRINVGWLSHKVITESTRRLARDYIFRLGIPVSEIETVTSCDVRFPKIPSGCYQCLYFHGEFYGSQILICAIHPQGLKDCPDFEPNTMAKIA